MILDDLRVRAEAIEAEFHTIHTEAGDAALTDDQQTRWNALEVEESEVREAIAHHEAIAERDARVAERRARWGSVQVSPQRTDPFDLNSMRHADGSALVDRARAFLDDRTATRGIPAEHVAEASRKLEMFAAAADENEDGQAAELARYMLVHGSEAYKGAFRTWFRAGQRGSAPVLSGAEAEAVRASMSLTSANGGYALPTLLDPSLVATGTLARNPIRAVSTVKTGMVNVYNGVTIGAVTTAWKGEGSAFTDGSPTTGAITVTAAALTAYVTGSYEIFADSNLLSDLPGLIAEAIDSAESAAFVVGSGSTAPTGIVTAISATAGSTVTATTRGSFTSASLVDTLAVYNALPVRVEDSSTWLMNKATFNTIKQQMIGTTGIPVIDLTDRNRLLDSPVVKASSMPSATTSGNVLAVLGDFSRFVIYDRIGVNLEFIQNVVDGDGLPVGKRGLVAYKRVGSNTADINAFRFLKA